jgi:hypothetical protein
VAGPHDYCTSDQVKQLAQIKGEQGGANRDAIIASSITRVSATIDQQTGTWFDSRAKTLYIDPVGIRRTRIFMPAPVVSITSITEFGNLLTYKDYVLAEPGAIRRTLGFWMCGQYDDGSAMHNGITVVGTFGFATVPPDVEEACAELSAIVAGIKKRTFVTGDGIEKAVTATTLPDIVKMILANRLWLDFTNQATEPN